MLHVKLHDAAVIKATFKLAGYQGQGIIFTHTLSTPRSGYCLRSNFLHGNSYMEEEAQSSCCTPWRCTPCTAGETPAVINVILILALKDPSHCLT